MKKNILIIGINGQIGQSIKGLYKEKNCNVGGIDINKKIDIPKGKIEIMHVCIPYGKEFEFNVLSYIVDYNPELVIINSTVQIGTTENIRDKGDVKIVHSPCMGKHPNLTDSFKTFTKIIGGSEEEYDLASNHFRDLGVSTIRYKKSENSEAAKMLSTTYYHLNIIFMKHVYEMCNEHNLDFDEVYRLTNNIYNNGYEEFGDCQFIRPVLNYMGKRTKGHCVSSNTKMLIPKFKLAKILDDLDYDFIARFRGD